MSRASNDNLREIVARFPTTRDEDWKYTDLSRARDIAARWLDAGAAAPRDSLQEEIASVTGTIEAVWLVIADGELQSSDTPDGVSVDILDAVPAGDSALAEFNAALVRDGIRIRFSRPVAEPLGLLIIDSATQTAVSQVYVEVEFEEGASGNIVEYHTSRGDADQYANVFVTMQLRAGSSANHVRLRF